MIDENDRAAARNGMPGSSFSDGGLGHILGTNEREQMLRNNGFGAGGRDESWQRLIVAACVGVPTAIGYQAEWLPIPGWSWWIVFFVATWTVLLILEWLPGWLSGSLMGLLLGSGAAYLGWLYDGLYWSVGAGLGAALIMYQLFSRLGAD